MRRVPEVGRYEGVPNETYHQKWDAVNASRLELLDTSPYALQFDLMNPEDKWTKATKFGSAAHVAILEPHLFGKQYVRAPEQPPESKAATWANTTLYREMAFRASYGITDEQWMDQIPLPPKKTASKKQAVVDEFNADTDYRNAKILELIRGRAARVVLSDEEWDGVRRVRDNVWTKSTEASALIEQATGAEVCYVADDLDTGLRCKIRVDLEADHAGLMVDLKTAREITVQAWMRQMSTYNYHRSAAFYLQVADLVRPGIYKRFVHLCVQNGPPWDVAIRGVGDASIWRGQEEVQPLLRLYAKCLEEDHWPSLGEEIEIVDLPDWRIASGTLQL